MNSRLFSHLFISVKRRLKVMKKRMITSKILHGCLDFRTGSTNKKKYITIFKENRSCKLIRRLTGENSKQQLSW